LDQVVEQIDFQKTIIADIQKIIEETGKLVEQGYFSEPNKAVKKLSGLIKSNNLQC
jgi:hypothetical protein